MTDRAKCRVLIFGGTGEARELAARLVADGYDVITSLAGATAAPILPEGGVVRGGFGGTAGIAAFAARQAIGAFIDATHPFAARISQHAQRAALDRGIPYLRLERPPWRPEPGDLWTEVAGIDQAVAAIPRAARVMLTVGRKEAAAFLSRPDLKGIVRMIEEPASAIPAGWTLIRERPPFAIGSEGALMDKHRIAILVSKNAGGEQTRAKLMAARERKIPVILVARPLKPGIAVATIPEVVSRLSQILHS